jgi:hypothetical protein
MLLQLRGLDLVCPDYHFSVTNSRVAADSMDILQYFARAFATNVNEVSMIHVNVTSGNGIPKDIALTLSWWHGTRSSK